ncbi:hypothetical protein [Halodesulfovibrio sp. MK-HDV]|uniref:hypothetical protein n=1 Tax=Halodesulfovibrio sp. MK-HDV TaxID=2599925 RepID=UPI0013683336|nr:hypothetical protein [Halodesulfovibrio sp. MK-HDV]KAF1073305.1 hypothetical protein MKHDV_03690 [Halodesulfovibrio sp. MK-HDV]
MREYKMPLMREAVSNLGKDNRVFSNQMLYAVLNVETDEERGKVRSRAAVMVKSGELVRVGRGEYRYNEDSTTARGKESVTRMWRGIKTATPGFSLQELARVSGSGYYHAMWYVKELEEQGYLRRVGKKRKAVLYAATGKMRKQQRAYIPSQNMKDPFAVEKASLHELVGIFLQQDLHQPRVKQQVVELAKIILERFEVQAEDA